MIPGTHCDLTHAPVAGWTLAPLLLALVLLCDWHTAQLDHELTYPQAPVKQDLHMLLLKGFVIEGIDNPNNYVLHVHRNIHGQKQAS